MFHEIELGGMNGGGPDIPAPYLFKHNNISPSCSVKIKSKYIVKNLIHSRLRFEIRSFRSWVAFEVPSFEVQSSDMGP
jgi:hypothetical protein